MVFGQKGYRLIGVRVFDYFAYCIDHLHCTTIYFVECGCWSIVWWRIRVKSYISKPRHTELLDCVDLGIAFPLLGGAIVFLH
jgi:hypothetical protein